MQTQFFKLLTCFQILKLNQLQDCLIWKSNSNSYQDETGINFRKVWIYFSKKTYTLMTLRKVKSCYTNNSSFGKVVLHSKPLLKELKILNICYINLFWTVKFLNKTKIGIILQNVMEQFNESDYLYSIRLSLKDCYFKKERMFEIDYWINMRKMWQRYYIYCCFLCKFKLNSEARPMNESFSNRFCLIVFIILYFCMH